MDLHRLRLAQVLWINFHVAPEDLWNIPTSLKSLKTTTNATNTNTAAYNGHEGGHERIKYPYTTASATLLCEGGEWHHNNNSLL
jgi:hypothetical protein